MMKRLRRTVRNDSDGKLEFLWAIIVSAGTEESSLRWRRYVTQLAIVQ